MPIFQWSSARQPLGTSGANVADFGSGLPVNFSGQTVNNLPSAFTVGGWMRWLDAPDIQSPYVLFGATGQFQMTIDQNGFVSASFTGGTGQVTSSLGASSLAINDGEWHFVLVTFAQGIQSGGGILQLFIDGLEIDAENVSAAGSTTPGDCTLGQNVDFMDFVSWCVWSEALSTDAIDVPIWGDPKGGTEAGKGLVAAWDFANGPATDLSGNNRPVTVACQNWISPGLTFVDGYASPAAADALNPGNGGPFTVSAWVCTESAELGSYLVLSNGSTSAALSVGLSYPETPGSGSAQVQYGQTQLNATGTPVFAAGEWVHVAVAYDGTSLLSLYLNGTLARSQSGVSSLSIPTPQLYIGGTLSQPGRMGYFMQAVTIWSTCLTQPNVAAYMYSDPTLIEGCVAYYPFLTDTVNTVTGNPLQLTNSSVEAQLVPMQLVAAATLAGGAGQMATPAPVGGDPQQVFPADIRALAAKLGIDASAPVAGTTPGLNLNAETAFFESLLKGLPSGIAGRLRTRFNENLTISRQLTAKGLSPGLFTGATVGTDRILNSGGPTGGSEVTGRGAG